MGTHYKGNKREVLLLNSYIKLVRAAESVSSRINSHILRKKITESQFAILDALYHIGPLCQKELGIKILRSGGNITHVIDNLEKQGLAKRVRGDDRRYFSVHITKQGKALMEKIFPKHLEYVIQELNILTDEEHLELQRLCKQIGTRSKESGEL